MEGRQFDALVASLARGENRRTLLKRIFGCGGAATAASLFGEHHVEAARRPTPAPKPITCPGQQIPRGSTCVCPDGLDKCGPDCCTPEAECCDNACCNGHCYGEELCCPYDNWCAAASQCCASGETCCGELGCVLIEEGDCGCSGKCPQGFECCGDQCCASGYCAGSVCCALGVCGDTCLSAEGNQCCNGVEYDPDTQICCSGEAKNGNCCRDQDCPGLCELCLDNQCREVDCG